MHAKQTALRSIGRPLGVALVVAQLFGCFALFTLDEYGPTNGPEDGGPIKPTTDVIVVEGSIDGQPLPQGKIVFVTNAQFSVEDTNKPDAISGIDLAHALCQEAAKNAGLKGTFLAWISDENTSPSQFFEALENDAAGPQTQLITPTHQIIAASYSELAQMGPRIPINVTESNALLPEGKDGIAGALACLDSGGGGGNNGLVWTATTERGDLQNKDSCCNSWRNGSNDQQGRVGRLVKDRTDWTSACSVLCNTKAHLYCFEQ